MWRCPVSRCTLRLGTAMIPDSRDAGDGLVTVWVACSSCTEGRNCPWGGLCCLHGVGRAAQHSGAMQALWLERRAVEGKGQRDLESRGSIPARGHGVSDGRTGCWTKVPTAMPRCLRIPPPGLPMESPLSPGSLHQSPLLRSRTVSFLEHKVLRSPPFCGGDG